MKFIFALTMVCMSFVTKAAADQLEYELEVNGMVCAFCAYNVSKQLRTLDGVVADSVDVDLDKGRVRLQSGKKLDESQLADLLLTAGFKLGAVSEVDALNAEPRQRPNEAAFLSMTISSDRLSEGQFDEVLEAIGAMAVQRSVRISVVGPEELELAILKPVLMGRRTVIDVEYEPVTRPDQSVVVSLSANH
jgi:copper chaperone CopZ